MSIYFNLLPKELKTLLLTYLKTRLLLDLTREWSIKFSDIFWIEKLSEDFHIDFKNYEHDKFTPHELYHLYTVLNEIIPEFHDDIDISELVHNLNYSRSPYNDNDELLLIIYNNKQYTIDIAKEISENSKLLDRFYKYLVKETDRKTIDDFLYKVMIFGRRYEVEQFIENNNIEYRVTMLDCNKIINKLMKYIHAESRYDANYDLEKFVKKREGIKN